MKTKANKKEKQKNKRKTKKFRKNAGGIEEEDAGNNKPKKSVQINTNNDIFFINKNENEKIDEKIIDERIAYIHDSIAKEISMYNNQLLQIHRDIEDLKFNTSLDKKKDINSLKKKAKQLKSLIKNMKYKYCYLNYCIYSYNSDKNTDYKELYSIINNCYNSYVKETAFIFKDFEKDILKDIYDSETNKNTFANSNINFKKVFLKANKDITSSPIAIEENKEENKEEKIQIPTPPNNEKKSFNSPRNFFSRLFTTSS